MELRTLLRNIDNFLNKGSLLRFLLGISYRQGITDKKSAELLLELSRRNRVDIRKINHPGFHPKLFVFYGNPSNIIIGSANLTEAAQSTNAEANLWVEDPDPRVFNDAQGFFEYYFNSAARLKQKDVDLYKSREPRGGRTLVGGPKEDELRSPPVNRSRLEAVKPKKIWKIAPGRDARDWEEWVSVIDSGGEGVVALGWGVGSLLNFETFDLLRKLFVKRLKVTGIKTGGEGQKLGMLQTNYGLSRLLLKLVMYSLSILNPEFSALLK